ncbi:tetratricopeptide repeat protein [Vibrio parahaemolyticus]|uniref:tetratricopeptide repeat protein n=1 Tax=Vibrio parahaemolyticus TaxID=670 RepID=UPI000812E3E5|nr:hypothetical protein [Vibrio parahaemolyticus]OCP55799.1 hypothetical protein AKH04_15015 [Vibrio parahaemolyticus]
MSKVIYEDDDILCYFYQGNSDYLLITFSPANFIASQEVEFWGAGLVIRNGISTIGIVAKENNWYPDSSLEKLRVIVQDYSSRFTNVISYGMSMGGYGALKHGKILGANYTVAFSPQYSIDPEIIGSGDKRYLNYFRNRNKNSFISDSDVTETAYIIYDNKYFEDDFNAKAIVLSSNNVVALNSPYMHHVPIELFSGSKRTIELFNLVLSSNQDKIKYLIAKRRRESSVRARHVIELVAQRSPILACSFYKKFHHTINTSDKAWLCGVISDLFIKSGDLHNAKKYANHSLELSPDDVIFLRRMSSIELKLSNFDKSIEYIEKAIDLSPNNVNLLNLLVSVYLRINDKLSALSILEVAIKVEPYNKDLLARIISVHLALGNIKTATKFSSLAYSNYPDDYKFFTQLLSCYQRDDNLSECYHVAISAIRVFGIIRVSEAYLNVMVIAQSVEYINRFLDGHLGPDWNKFTSYNVTYQIHLINKNFELAERVLLDELPNNHNNSNFLFRLCSFYGLIGNKNEAIRYAEKAWLSNGNDVNTAARYISTLIWFNDKNRAREIIDTADSIFPNSKVIMEQKERLLN